MAAKIHKRESGVNADSCQECIYEKKGVLKLQSSLTWQSNVYSLALYKEDKEAAERAVRVLVGSANMQTFTMMLNALKAVMLRYGKDRLEFRDFVVTLTRNGIPRIQGKKKATECPGCGSKEGWKYLRTAMEGKPHSQDLVVWGCRNCGTVFNKWEQNWDDDIG